MPHFGNIVPIDLYFTLPIVAIPVHSRVVQAEVELDVALVGQAQKELGHIHIHRYGLHLSRDNLRGMREPRTPTRADENNRVDTRFNIGVKLLRPLFDSPVVAGNICRHLI